MEEKRGGGPKRKKEEIQVDCNFIMPLFLKGKGFTEIAKELAPLREYRVNANTVWADVNRVLTKWQAERMDMIDKQMTLDLKKIDQLEATYWEAWEDSKKAKVKTVQKERAMFDKKKNKRLGDLTNQQAERHVQEGIGDKRWLEGVQWCIQQRAELLRYKHIPPAPPEDMAPPIGELVFVTRTRKNNEHIQEAIEITETPDTGQKLLPS